MTRLIHPIAGAVALLTIAAFWLSTVVSELSGSEAAVVAVKTAIPWGFLWLIPAIAASGGSGFVLARGRRGRVIDAKIRRTPLIAANGALVLAPCALFLAARARDGDLDAAFYTVQALELAAGAANLVLLGLSYRDGLTLSGRLRRRKPRSTAAVAEVR